MPGSYGYVCKNETTTEEPVSMSAEFNTLLGNYYEDGLKLNPVMATFAGDNRYNDQFPNPLALLEDKIDDWIEANK